LDYLTQFFDKKGFNGKEFIAKHVPSKQPKNGDNNNNNTKKTSGFGLTIVKEVCKQFDQKTGQYTKVKKQLSAWAKKNVERHQKESAFSMDDIKENMGMDNNNNANNNDQNGNNGGNIVNQSVQSEAVNNSDKNGGSGASAMSKGEKWYWFCDEGGIKWVPYKDEHQKIIETAWVNNKPNVIVMTKFKIDFHRDNNNGVASGQQYNYQIHNSWRRGVIRGTPDNNQMLNDIPCDQYPR